MLLKIRNLLAEDAPYSNLSVAVNSGTSLPVQNINGYEASYAVQIGKTGEERSEIKVLNGTTPAGTQVQLTSAISYPHPEDTPVYNIKFDQIVVKRSSSGTSGAATPLGTISIQPDSEYTTYEDASGASTYAYRASYRNSVTGDESINSDWLTDTGYSFYSLARIRERVKNRLSNAGYLKSDDQVDEWINEWMEAMQNEAINVNQDYALTETTVVISDQGRGTVSDTNFKQVRKVELTTDGVNYYMSTKMKTIDFDEDSLFYKDKPFHYYIGDNVIGFKPESAGTARILYSQLITPLVNESDELPVSLRSYTKSFIDYAHAMALYNDDKYNEGDRFMQFAENGKLQFISQITPRDRSGAEFMQITEELSNNIDFI